MIGYPVFVDDTLENPVDHQHEQVAVEVKINNNVGFKWNETTETYELIAELDAWDLDVPVNRFIDKISQQYAIELITDEGHKLGFEVEYQSVNDRNDVELVLTKW